MNEAQKKARFTRVKNILNDPDRETTYEKQTKKRKAEYVNTIIRIE